MAHYIVDGLNEEQLQGFIMMFRGIIKSEEDDEAFCQQLVDEYMADNDPSKHETMSLEDYAKTI